MVPDSERTLLLRRLISELSEEGRSIGELSRRYKLNRRTIHKRQKRYQQACWAGLEEQTRRPHRSPRQEKSAQWKEVVFELKRRQRRWGAK